MSGQYTHFIFRYILKADVICDITLCILVDRFGGTCCPLFRVEGYLENGCIRFLQNIDNYLPYHTMLHKKTAVFKIFYGYMNPKTHHHAHKRPTSNKLQAR